MNVAILGGGISGLSAAWYLLKQEPKANISLFEATHRLGGWFESKTQDGFTFELGPRTFQTGRCPELLAMIRELGLEPIFSTKEHTKFLWHQNQMRPIHSFWPELLRAALQDLVMPRGSSEDETIYEFAKRRLGKRGAELFFDPMTKGVYGGDIRKLSLRASFPLLFEAEQKERSLLKWMLKRKKESGLFTLSNGIEQLVEALKRLPIDIHLNTPVEAITSEGVATASRFWPADLIISALPGLAISRLTNIPLSLRNESISVVNFGFHGNVLSKKGVGYLVPSTEKENILGQIWDTSLFPVPGQTKLTSMVKGELPIETAKSALKRHLNIQEAPTTILSKEGEIPQYDIGHLFRIKAFEEAILSRFQGKLKLVGNYLVGVSVESCLKRSKLISTNCK